MNHLAKRIAFFTLALILSLSTLNHPPVNAAVIYDSSLVQPTIPNTFSVAQEQSTDYLNPSNSYDDDNPTYIFVTQDSTKAGTTSITYKGISYPVTTLISTGNDLSKLSDASGSILRKDMTIFFDAGTYNDRDGDNYFGFSKQNLSLVGLTAGSVIITRSLRSNGTMERNGFNAPNIYLENLIFDGRSTNMSTDSRGQYFFFFTGANPDFVMKNCTIQNVGASTSAGSSKNVAINFYTSSGQHNFENIIIRNVKTTSGLGIISFNQTNGNYFKNVTIVGDYTNAYSNSIKVEHTATTNGIAENQNSAYFTGTLQLPTDSNHNFVYVQSWNYNKVVVPANFRYAQYSTSNGGNSTAAIKIYQDVLPVLKVSSFFGNYYYSILDLQDNSWLVRPGQSVTVDDQFANIKTTIKAAGTKAPEPNIKLVADSSGKINGFSVPDFGTSHNVNIVAESLSTDIFSSTNFVSASVAATITLPTTNSSNIVLYNFDFATYAKYTLQEAVDGIDPSKIIITDPNEGGSIVGYPSYSTYGPSTSVPAKVVNATKTNFGNCKFTSLVNKIIITSPPASLTVGSSVKLTGQLASTDDNSYTASSISTNISGSADDQSIEWFSSDPSITSVDLNTGVVTGVSTGAATIYAKAVDANNQGEIEKPFASLAITVEALPTNTPTFTPTVTATFTPTVTITPSIAPTANPNTSPDSRSAVAGAIALPITGFTPGRITRLPINSSIFSYNAMGDLWLEIPSQKVQMNIIGVPLDKGHWDITWLGENAGYLEGSAYPTFNGNSVLTGHVYLSTGKPGPFENIKDLKYGDDVIIHAFGEKYIYQVQSIDYLRPNEVKKLLEHKETPWLTLLTCYQYNEVTDTYRLRVAVRAELVSSDTDD